MKKNKKKDSKELPKEMKDSRFEIIKRTCEICKRKFNGTRYQKWCTHCKEVLNKVDWEWDLWI